MCAWKGEDAIFRLLKMQGGLPSLVNVFIKYIMFFFVMMSASFNLVVDLLASQSWDYDSMLHLSLVPRL